MRQSAAKVVLHFNKRNTDGTISAQSGEIPLLQGTDRIWREHTDPDVDVLAFEVTAAFVDHPEIERRWARYEDFADAEKLAELEISIGEEILVVGYPLGVRHRKTNFPLVRSGIIATRIGEDLEDEQPVPTGGTRKRVLRGFLIDGATVPGSSGSPVVLKPMIGRFMKGVIAMGGVPLVLLGIVAETRFAPIQLPAGAIPSFAGLGLAFDAITVKETIELFFPWPCPSGMCGPGHGFCALH